MNHRGTVLGEARFPALLRNRGEDGLMVEGKRLSLSSLPTCERGEE